MSTSILFKDITTIELQNIKKSLLKHVLSRPGKYVCFNNTPADIEFSNFLKSTRWLPTFSNFNEDYFIATCENKNEDEFAFMYICEHNKKFIHKNCVFGDFIKEAEKAGLDEFMLVLNVANISSLVPKTKPKIITDAENEDLLKLFVSLIPVKDVPVPVVVPVPVEKEECCICLDDFDKCAWHCGTCKAGLICKGCKTKMKGIISCPVCRTTPKPNKKKK